MMKDEKKISKTKKISTRVNFSNSWLRLLDWIYHVWKNHKAQFSINQMFKDKIEKRIWLYKTKQKIKIKRMMIKVEIKKIRGQV